MIEPSFIPTLKENLSHYPKLIHVVLGPRQVGKSTGVLKFLKQYKYNSLYCSADEMLSPDIYWIQEKWQQAISENAKLLVIDEIQKIPNWSSIIKKLWDSQKSNPQNEFLQLLILGSSSLDIQKGLSESLTGRFLKVHAPHWGFSLSKQLAAMQLEDFLQYGGYPGSYELLKNKKLWAKYIQESIIETVIGKDILNLAQVRNPALFKQAFEIITSYPAQEISYTKLLGQLQSKGNTDLVKYYIELYEGAFLVKSLQKYSPKPILKRASSPKLLPLCGALIHRDVFQATDGMSRAFEAAVGAALVHAEMDVYYWRDGNKEVDYICNYNHKIYALEVKSGKIKNTHGMDEFLKLNKKAVPIFINQQNITKFLNDPAEYLEKF